jgi:hypothetical protein
MAFIIRPYKYNIYSRHHFGFPQKKNWIFWSTNQAKKRTKNGDDALQFCDNDILIRIAQHKYVCKWFLSSLLGFIVILFCKHKQSSRYLSNTTMPILIQILVSQRGYTNVVLWVTNTLRARLNRRFSEFMKNNLYK